MLREKQSPSGSTKTLLMPDLLQGLLLLLLLFGFVCLFVGFFWVFVVVVVVCLFVRECPGTHSVDQAGLELRNLPACASRVLGLKVCATMPVLSGVGTCQTSGLPTKLHPQPPFTFLKRIYYIFIYMNTL